jgi:GNAT superfamily N-acetyltransferase
MDNKEIYINKEDLDINPASGGELDIIFRLLKNAAEWLAVKGIDYWQNWHDPPEAHKNWIKTGFDNNEFYLVRFNNEVIGCFRLLWEDHFFWGKQEDPAGYVHSLTRVSSIKAKNTGKAILAWIEDFCRKNGKKYIRLDCGVNLPVLRGYYEMLGFKNAGTVTVENEELVLYEKEIL